MNTETQEGPLKFRSSLDFWGYKWIGHCYYFESREGDMLMGDGLPVNEEEARKICRAANCAHLTAKESFSKKVRVAFNGLLKEV